MFNKKNNFPLSIETHKKSFLYFKVFISKTNNKVGKYKSTK